MSTETTLAEQDLAWLHDCKRVSSVEDWEEEIFLERVGKHYSDGNDIAICRERALNELISDRLRQGELNGNK